MMQSKTCLFVLTSFSCVSGPFWLRSWFSVDQGLQSQKAKDSFARFKNTKLSTRPENIRFLYEDFGGL